MSLTTVAATGETDGVECSTVLPAIMVALEALRARMPDTRNGGFTQPTGSSETTVEDFKRDFLKKTLCVVCPAPDYSKAPNVDIAACSGTKLYMVRWQLHFPNLRLRCRCGIVM